MDVYRHISSDWPIESLVEYCSHYLQIWNDWLSYIVLFFYSCPVLSTRPTVKLSSWEEDAPRALMQVVISLSRTVFHDPNTFAALCSRLCTHRYKYKQKGGSCSKRHPELVGSPSRCNVIRPNWVLFCWPIIKNRERIEKIIQNDTDTIIVL